MTSPGTTSPASTSPAATDTRGAPVVRAVLRNAEQTVVITPIEFVGSPTPSLGVEWEFALTDKGLKPVVVPVTGVMLRTYDCPSDGPVEFYVVEGGGHAWPGSEFSRSIEKIIGMTNMELHASELIWDFLSSHRLPTD